MPNRRRRTLWSSTTTATIPIDRPTTAVTPPPQKSLAWACPLPSNADGEARRQPPFATFKARAVSKRKGRCGRPCSALRPSDCLRPLLCVLGLTPTGLWPLFLRPSSRVEIEAVSASSGTIEDYRDVPHQRFARDSPLQIPGRLSLREHHITSTQVSTHLLRGRTNSLEFN